MKKIFDTIAIILMIGISLGVASAQAGGGGVGQAIPYEEWYDIQDDFTKCLLDNCDYLCKIIEFDDGEYYKEDKCWCEKYHNTKHGKVVIKDGWVQIEECIPKEEIKNKQKENLIAIFGIVGIMFVGYLIGRIIEAILIGSWNYPKKKRRKRK